MNWSRAGRREGQKQISCRVFITYYINSKKLWSRTYHVMYNEGDYSDLAKKLHIEKNDSISFKTIYGRFSFRNSWFDIFPNVNEIFLDRHTLSRSIPGIPYPKTEILFEKYLNGVSIRLDHNFILCDHKNFDVLIRQINNLYMDELIGNGITYSLSTKFPGSDSRVNLDQNVLTRNIIKVIFIVVRKTDSGVDLTKILKDALTRQRRTRKIIHTS